jgi:hypothetical protein
MSVASATAVKLAPIALVQQFPRLTKIALGHWVLWVLATPFWESRTPWSVCFFAPPGSRYGLTRCASAPTKRAAGQTGSAPGSKA